MFQAEPMQNFNKNNPFIIIAKRKFDTITDEIQNSCKMIIRDMIITTSIEVVFILVQIIELVFFKVDNYMLWSLLLLVFIDTTVAYNWQNRIKYFYKDHESMREFDRLSRMETSDILVLNNEDILNCVQGLYELDGELKATIKYYTYLIRGLISFSVLLILISIFSAYLILK